MKKDTSMFEYIHAQQLTGLWKISTHAGQDASRTYTYRHVGGT